MLIKQMYKFNLILIWTGLLSCTPGGISAPAECRHIPWMRINDVIIHQSKSKKYYFFQSGMFIDADGSPRAYHPDNTGLDDLKHATSPDGSIDGIVYIHGKPVLQEEGDPAPGYYVSQTSLVDPSKAITDQNRYVNSEEIPYIALPHWLAQKGSIKLGDIALVYNSRNKWYTYAIFADHGPPEIIGEGSMALADMLGIDNDPRKGGANAGIHYVVFPDSGNEGPLSKKQIRKRGKKLITEEGGLDKLLKCINI